MERKATLFTITAMLTIAVMLAGCTTTRSMALNGEQAAPGDAGRTPIGLLSLQVGNKNLSTPEPACAVKIVVIASSGEEIHFEPDKPVTETSEYNEYLVSMALPPGRTLIKMVLGFAGRAGGAWMGRFGMPVQSWVMVPERGLFYLGRVKGIVRARTSDAECRAGGIFPLLWQAAAGLSDGTFDVTFSDEYKDDIHLFQRKYPILRDGEIGKQLLEKDERLFKECL